MSRTAGSTQNALTNRSAHVVAADNLVPGRAGSTAAQAAIYDRAALGFRVLVANGNRYTKTSALPYDGVLQVITQEGAAIPGTDGLDITATGLAGIAVGTVVMLEAAGTIVAADAGAAATGPAFGFVTTVVAPGTTYVVRRAGEVTAPLVTGGPLMVAGTDYYLSDTLGEITAVPPVNAGALVQYIGRARSTTVLEVSGCVPGIGSTNYAIVGNVAHPSYAFFSDSDTGMYWSAANEISVAANGVQQATFGVTGIRAQDGAVALPSYSFISDPNTGMYSSAADEISVAANGIQQATVGVTGIRAQAGVLATPSYSFLLDPNTGIWNSAANTIGVVTNGLQTVTIDTTGIGVTRDSAATNGYLAIGAFARTVTGAGLGAAGIGIQNTYTCEADAGTPNLAGAVGALLTDATDAATVGCGEIVGAAAGALCGAGIRAQGVAGAIVNGVVVTPSAASANVSIAPYGTGADLTLALFGVGAAKAGVSLRNPANTITVLGIEIQAPAAHAGVVMESTLTAAGVSPRTANTASGVALFTDAALATLVINCDLVTATSLVFVQIVAVTTVAISILRAVPGVGTITIVLSAAAGASGANIAFLVVNPAT